MSFDSKLSISFEIDNNKYELLLSNSNQSSVDLLGVSPSLSPEQINKVRNQLANLSTKEEIVSKLKFMGATITQEIVKTHYIGVNNLNTLTNPISVDEFINRVKMCTKKLTEPPKQEKSDEMMRQLNLLSELKKLHLNVSRLDTQANSSNLDFKAAEKALNNHIIAIKQTLDATPIGQIRQEEVDNRNKLDVIRMKALSDIEKGISSEQVAKEMSLGIIQFVRTVFEEGIKTLGPPPCKYALSAFGSLARYESGPYPDLDNMLILERKDENTLKYFTRLYAHVEERLYRLGESESLGKPGLRLCTGAGSPLYPQYDFRRSADLTILIEELKSIEIEIEKLKENPSGKIQGKLDNLNKLKELKNNEIVKLQQEGFGGRLDLYIEATLKGVQGGSELTSEQLKKMQNDQRAMADNIFVCGDLDLYHQYRKIVSESIVGNITQSDSEILESIKSMLKKIEEGATPGAVSPIISLKLSPVTYIKEELYRFPQVIVSILAAKYQIAETNSAERIKALQEKGVFSKSFGDKLIESINQAVKLRILSQSKFHEEWDFVTTVEWNKYNAYKSHLRSEVDRLPELHARLLKIESELKELKSNQNDTTAKLPSAEIEGKLRDLKTEISKIEFYKFRLELELPKMEEGEFGFQKAHEDLNQLRQSLPKISDKINQNEVELLSTKLESYKSRGFTVSDPASFEVFKEAIVSDTDLINLEDNILPTLHELYMMAKESVNTGRLVLNAFSK